jgi:hypothetical protein
MKYSLLTGTTLLAIAIPAAAQSSADRFERQLQQIQQQTRQRINPDVPAGQRAMVDYGAFLSTNFLAIDDEQQDTHLLFEPDLYGYFRLNLDGAHEFFLRARASYRDFYQDNSFDERGDTKEALVEQAYYRFDLGRYLAGKGKPTANSFSVTAGRQFVLWANGLVLGQYLDGIAADFSFGKLEFSALGGVTVPQMTIDFDTSRRSFNDHTDRGFFGGMAAMQLGAHRPFVYGLIQRDFNSDDPVEIGPGISTDFEYNSWYIGAGANGSLGSHLVYATELAYEGGRALSNSFTVTSEGAAMPVDQDKEDVSAAAADFRLDYVLGDPNRSRFTFETILATGATDRFSSTSDTFGGIEPGSTDHAFNALGMLDSGLAFAPQVSNLTLFRFGASTFPFTSRGLKRLQAGADFYVFGKFNSHAPIYELTSDDWFLGVEPEVFLNWQITSDVTLALRYAVFFPGTAIVQDEHPRNFFFAGLTFSF